MEFMAPTQDLDAFIDKTIKKCLLEYDLDSNDTESLLDDIELNWSNNNGQTTHVLPTLNNGITTHVLPSSSIITPDEKRHFEQKQQFEQKRMFQHTGQVHLPNSVKLGNDNGNRTSRKRQFPNQDISSNPQFPNNDFSDPNRNFQKCSQTNPKQFPHTHITNKSDHHITANSIPSPNQTAANPRPYHNQTTANPSPNINQDTAKSRQNQTAANQSLNLNQTMANSSPNLNQTTDSIALQHLLRSGPPSPPNPNPNSGKPLSSELLASPCPLYNLQPTPGQRSPSYDLDPASGQRALRQFLPSTSPPSYGLDPATPRLSSSPPNPTPNPNPIASPDITQHERESPSTALNEWEPRQTATRDRDSPNAHLQPQRKPQHTKLKSRLQQRYFESATDRRSTESSSSSSLSPGHLQPDHRRDSNNSVSSSNNSNNSNNSISSNMSHSSSNKRSHSSNNNNTNANGCTYSQSDNTKRSRTNTVVGRAVPAADRKPGNPGLSCNLDLLAQAANWHRTSSPNPNLHSSASPQLMQSSPSLNLTPATSHTTSPHQYSPFNNIAPSSESETHYQFTNTSPISTRDPGKGQRDPGQGHRSPSHPEAAFPYQTSMSHHSVTNPLNHCIKTSQSILKQQLLKSYDAMTRQTEDNRQTEPLDFSMPSAYTKPKPDHGRKAESVTRNLNEKDQLSSLFRTNVDLSQTSLLRLLNEGNETLYPKPGFELNRPSEGQIYSEQTKQSNSYPNSTVKPRLRRQTNNKTRKSQEHIVPKDHQQDSNPNTKPNPNHLSLNLTVPGPQGNTNYNTNSNSNISASPMNLLHSRIAKIITEELQREDSNHCEPTITTEPNPNPNPNPDQRRDTADDAKRRRLVVNPLSNEYIGHLLSQNQTGFVNSSKST